MEIYNNENVSLHYLEHFNLSIKLPILIGFIVVERCSEGD